jgi:hypothetical protein
MNVTNLVDRARADFVEMPRLELTLSQAARLWSVGIDDCRLAVDALVASGFVTWTTRGTIVRTGRDSERPLPYMTVVSTPKQDKAV